MSQALKIKDSPAAEIFPALRVELLKVRRSKTLWITALAFALLIFIGGLFMFILKDPERARSLGLLGAKAELFGGSADWPSFISLMLLLTGVGGLVIFGFIYIWEFGREFGDKTVYDMLALPTSRLTIVAAKITTAACWSLALVLLAFFLMLGVGAALQLPGGSAAIVLNGFKNILVTGSLTVLLCITFGLIASFTRGYLPAVGGIFLVLLLGEVISRLGYGQFFPWTVPMLYSGAAEALTGATATPLKPVSYILVAAVGVLSVVFSGLWWRSADQT
jgi:ABC-2 type transport system permease protein